MNRLFAIIGIVVVGLLLMISSGVMAQSMEKTDGVTISVTPNVSYAIKIDTPTGGFDFSTVDLDSVYYSTTSVGISTVTNSGGVVADWKVKGIDAAVWSLGTGRDSVGEDQMAVSIVITATTTAPGDIHDAAYGADDVLLTDASYPMDGNSYSVDASGIDGDNVPSGGKRRIWLRMHTPSATTTDQQQDFSLRIEAWTNDAF